MYRKYKPLSNAWWTYAVYPYAVSPRVALGLMTCGAVGTLRNDKSKTTEVSTSVVVGYVKGIGFCHAKYRIRGGKADNVSGNSTKQGLGDGEWCRVGEIDDVLCRFVKAGSKTGCVSIYQRLPVDEANVGSVDSACPTSSVDERD